MQRWVNVSSSSPASPDAPRPVHYRLPLYLYLFISLNPHRHQQHPITPSSSSILLQLIIYLYHFSQALWVASRPMDDEKKLQDQVEMSVAASAAMGLNQTVWVYRGSMWAYPWLENTRKTLDDPAYADWYIKFKPEGPYYSSKCDNNYNPPKCSDYYHNQEQSPGYPTGDGNCPAPNCDCGVVPCKYAPLLWIDLVPLLTSISQSY